MVSLQAVNYQCPSLPERLAAEDRDLEYASEVEIEVPGWVDHPESVIHEEDAPMSPEEVEEWIEFLVRWWLVALYKATSANVATDRPKKN